MNRYKGTRDAKDALENDVWVETDLGERRVLAHRFDLRNHSPTGFEWGYGGSGPAQLALAICAHVVDDARALRVYQAFKRKVVGTLPREGFDLTENFVRNAIIQIEEEMKKDGAGWVVVLKPLEHPMMVEHSGKVKLKDLYRFTECEIVDCVSFEAGDRWFDLWVDDEGLLNDSVKPNRVTPAGGVLCGTLAICASNDGESRALTAEEANVVMAEVKKWKVCPEGTPKPEPSFQVTSY
jgi:hypothetical protein